MEELHRQGRIIQTKPGTVPAYKRYLDEGKGVPLGSVWDDINPIHSSDTERLGYPTQKPLKLLERILEISSEENDIVLDAFCGCGTALVAAQKLKRQWIGIDVSPTACRVMAMRLKKDCGLKEDEKLQQIGRGFICARPAENGRGSQDIRPSSSRIGLWLRSAGRRKRGTWATWGSTVAFIQ